MRMQPVGTAVITGASSGIGSVYADRLAARGHDLLLVARRRDRLEALAEVIGKRHDVTAEIAAIDVTDSGDLASIEAQLRERGDVSMLVNNAGSGALGPTAAVDVDRIDNLIRLNVVALARLSHAALIGFRRRGSGGMINIGSIMAHCPSATAGVYSATKAFVANFTRSLQMEHRGSAIVIQLVQPGPVRTEFFVASGATEDIFPSESFLTAEQLVDAALKGFDNREAVTTPSLLDLSLWDSLETTRKNFLANVGSGSVAARYVVQKDN